MARRSATAKDIAAIEAEISKLAGEIESRMGRLNRLARRGTTHAVSEAGDYLSERAASVLESLRGGASYAGERLSDGVHEAGGYARSNALALGRQANTYGSHALQRVGSEIQHRPLTALAIVAGIGLLAGLATRRAA